MQDILKVSMIKIGANSIITVISIVNYIFTSKIARLLERY